MGYKLVIADHAEEDIIESYSWYEKRKINLGEEFFKELDILFEFHRSNPYLFPVKRKTMYREAVLKRFPFVIIYVIDEREVTVLSVFKTPQNPELKP